HGVPGAATLHVADEAALRLDGQHDLPPVPLTRTLEALPALGGGGRRHPRAGIVCICWSASGTSSGRKPRRSTWSPRSSITRCLPVPTGRIGRCATGRSLRRIGAVEPE